MSRPIQRGSVWWPDSYLHRYIDRLALSLIHKCRVVHLGGTTDKERARFRLFIRKTSEERTANETRTHRGGGQREDREHMRWGVATCVHDNKYSGRHAPTPVRVGFESRIDSTRLVEPKKRNWLELILRRTGIKSIFDSYLSIALSADREKGE